MNRDRLAGIFAGLGLAVYAFGLLLSATYPVTAYAACVALSAAMAAGAAVLLAKGNDR